MTTATLYSPEKRALLLDRPLGRYPRPHRVGAVGDHQVVTSEDVLSHVVDRDAAFPAARERLPLQLREAKDRAPLGEVIAGAVHRQPGRELQLAGWAQTTR